MASISRAHQLWQLLEPIHAVTYFAAEPLAALTSAGYRGYWMGYFAQRAAPLGEARPELVHALFYNFTTEHVARALPDAWTFAPPADALAARMEGSTAALRRILGPLASTDGVRTAADLAIRAAEGAPSEGRALFAANAALPVPDEPLARLWHGATLLREHRGDGHIAALLSADVGGREAHVLVAVARGLPPEIYRQARQFDDDEWSTCLERLRRRGLLDVNSCLTEHGRKTVEAIDVRTDTAAWTAFAHLRSTDIDALIAALQPLTAAVRDSGDLPLHTPMGLDLSREHDRVARKSRAG